MWEAELSELESLEVQCGAGGLKDRLGFRVGLLAHQHGPGSVFHDSPQREL